MSKNESYKYWSYGSSAENRMDDGASHAFDPFTSSDLISMSATDRKFLRGPKAVTEVTDPDENVSSIKRHQVTAMDVNKLSASRFDVPGYDEGKMDDIRKQMKNETNSPLDIKTTVVQTFREEGIEQTLEVRTTKNVATTARNIVSFMSDRSPMSYLGFKNSFYTPHVFRILDPRKTVTPPAVTECIDALLHNETTDMARLNTETVKASLLRAAIDTHDGSVIMSVVAHLMNTMRKEALYVFLLQPDAGKNLFRPRDLEIARCHYLKYIGLVQDNWQVRDEMIAIGCRMDKDEHVGDKINDTVFNRACTISHKTNSILNSTCSNASGYKASSSSRLSNEAKQTLTKMKDKVRHRRMRTSTLFRFKTKMINDAQMHFLVEQNSVIERSVDKKLTSMAALHSGGGGGIGSGSKLSAIDGSDQEKTFLGDVKDEFTTFLNKLKESEPEIDAENDPIRYVISAQKDYLEAWHKLVLDMEREIKEGKTDAEEIKLRLTLLQEIKSPMDMIKYLFKYPELDQSARLKKRMQRSCNISHEQMFYALLMTLAEQGKWAELKNCAKKGFTSDPNCEDWQGSDQATRWSKSSASSSSVSWQLVFDIVDDSSSAIGDPEKRSLLELVGDNAVKNELAIRYGFKDMIEAPSTRSDLRQHISSHGWGSGKKSSKLKGLIGRIT